METETKFNPEVQDNSYKFNPTKENLKRIIKEFYIDHTFQPELDAYGVQKDYHIDEYIIGKWKHMPAIVASADPDKLYFMRLDDQEEETRLQAILSEIKKEERAQMKLEHESANEVKNPQIKNNFKYSEVEEDEDEDVIIGRTPSGEPIYKASKDHQPRGKDFF